MSSKFYCTICDYSPDLFVFRSIKAWIYFFSAFISFLFFFMEEHSLKKNRSSTHFSLCGCMVFVTRPDIIQELFFFSTFSQNHVLPLIYFRLFLDISFGFVFFFPSLSKCFFSQHFSRRNHVNIYFSSPLQNEFPPFSTN